MMKLEEIIKGINAVKIVGSTDINIISVEFDSRKVQEASLFVAVKGTQADGHAFIPQAIEKGAVAVVCEQLTEPLNKATTYIQVTDAAFALGKLASAFYNEPSKKLKLVGVTGTNGKTTIATALYRLFKQLGYKAGLISTIRYIINDNEVDASHTTPDALTIQKMLAQMVNEGCEFCFMEVSSHAVVQKRIAGLRFAGGIFTNLTHDHLDYHKSFKEYLDAKKEFFNAIPEDGFAITNNDDKNGKIMVQDTKASDITYGLKSMADYKARIIESHFDGTLFEFNGNEVWTVFIGEFNVYNLLAVIAASIELGENEQEVLKLVSALKPADGRFEYVKSNDGKVAIVDYAHTPDALENVLSTINKLRKGDERIITVFGAGGNRDKLKRPKMGKVAVENSDIVVVTSDNPRNEEADEIIKDIVAGIDKELVNKYISITDRKEAIKTAITLAKPGDIILVAGKGHETYQEVKGVRHHFDDKEIIKEFFNIP